MFFLVSADTIVITMHPLFCIGNGFFSRWKRCRYVLWLHDFFPSHAGLYYWYNRLADFYVGRLGAALFVSPAIRDEYARRVPSHGRTHRDVMELAITPTVSARAPDPGLIGFIGNLKTGQGIERAIDALVIDPSLRLEIIGDGVSLGALRAYVQQAGVADRVRFLGAITDDAAQRVVDARWIAALALYEDDGYVTYADPGKVKLYWQHGVPVVMTRCTHLFPTVASLRAGELVEPTGQSVLTAVRRIAQNPQEYVAGIARVAARYETRTYFDRKLSFLA